MLECYEEGLDSHLVYSLVGAAECRNAAVLGNLSKEEECLRRFQFFGNGTITLVAADDEKKKLMDKNNNGTEDELPLELKPSAETVYLNVSVADVAHSLEPKAYGKKIRKVHLMAPSLPSFV
jgi:hypothetical protein